MTCRPLSTDIRNPDFLVEGKDIATSEVRQQLAAHLPRLWRYGLVLSRNRDIAEELVQSTCVRALERSSQYTPGTRIDRWLFSILHSIWISELRARHVRHELLAPDTREQDETRLHYMKVMQRVNALPEAQRNAVFLVYVEGFTYQEAAETLAVPIGTVMSRLATARARLARSADALPPVKEKRS